jgi:hypothetical protein
VVLLVQVAALAVWPALDPGVHASAVSQVEARGAAHPAAHDESRCQICQTSMRLAAAPATSPNLGLALEVRLSPTLPDAPAPRVIARQRCSRSPPVTPA